MKRFKLLVLTDHRNHSSENSLYSLAKAIRQDERCASVAVASKGNAQNDSFFQGVKGDRIFVNQVEDDFDFHPDGLAFENAQELATSSFDVVWLRMPPPLSKSFCDFLTVTFSTQVVFNNPRGIYNTGSKEFLINFPEVCPPMKICKTLEDITQFKNQHSIVLKPFREYGGKGIVRIDGERVWEGKDETTFDQFSEKIKKEDINYLGVKFLENVGQGDKRIIVVSGMIMGASLRTPAKDSWICNVAMGGTAEKTTIDPEEEEIVAKVNPTLSEMGIVMYGLDTLMGDDGKRVLSEINTTSIGGLPQIAIAEGKPLLEKATQLIWDYIVIKNRSLTNPDGV